jgi:Asp-tRNA(Asn)/Glu-tRNA(Gln) amidotransferase A subunit family amidase
VFHDIDKLFHFLCAGMQGAPCPPPALTLPKSLHARSATNGKRPLAGKRIALYKAWFEDANPQIVEATSAALRLMEAEGCEVSKWPTPGVAVNLQLHGVYYL